MTVGPVDLRARRHSRGVSSREAAHQVGVHPNTWLRWERRDRLPGPTELRKISSLLDLPTRDVADFFDRARPAAPPTDGVRAPGLRAVRRAASVSVATLAAGLGVPSSTVYNWEACRVRVPDAHLEGLSRLLGMPVDRLATALRHASPGPPLPPPETPLRRLRRRTDLSVSEAARRAGVPRERLGGWERSDRPPPLHALRLLARAYGVPTGTVAEAAGTAFPRLLDPTRWGPGDLSDALRTLRTWSGLTQRAMAQELGCSRASVKAWEAGRHLPAPCWRERLEQLHRLPAGALLRSWPATRA